MGVFVTGTDTGVGKTFVAAALAVALRRRGADVGVMKPVASGCVTGVQGLISRDAVKLQRAAGTRDPRQLVTPFALRPPLAPSVALRLAGRRFALARVLAAYRSLASRHEFMIVEGVGGLLVPISEKLCVADLASQLGLPLLVVSANRLGTVNHTLLTLAEARRRHLAVGHLVLNDQAQGRGDLSRRSNAAELERCASQAVLRLPHCKSLQAAARCLAPLAEDLLRWPKRR